MRTDSYNSDNNLHWHNGTTCHGNPTQAEAENQAVENRWVGKILEREDVYGNGVKVTCYSVIAGYFDNHGKHGKYVSEIKVVAVPVNEGARP